MIGTGDTELKEVDEILRETELTTISSNICPKRNTADRRSIICTETTLSLGTPFFGDSGMFTRYID